MLAHKFTKGAAIERHRHVNDEIMMNYCATLVLTVD